MKTVFFDVDTQLDFLFPGGALYVPGAEEVGPTLSELTAFAAKSGIPIISTLDSHTEDDPEFKTWKPHCVIGTQGQQKYSRTIADAKSGQQIIVPKNTIDVFASEDVVKVLDETAGERYVVYGLVTEYCVRAAIFGLLQRKVRVELVVDAIRSLDEAEGMSILNKFAAEGGRIVTRLEVTG